MYGFAPDLSATEYGFAPDLSVTEYGSTLAGGSLPNLMRSESRYVVKQVFTFFRPISVRPSLTAFSRSCAIAASMSLLSSLLERTYVFVSPMGLRPRHLIELL